jgi:hypothetical protein
MLAIGLISVTSSQKLIIVCLGLEDGSISRDIEDPIGSGHTIIEMTLESRSYVLHVVWVNRWFHPEGQLYLLVEMRPLPVNTSPALLTDI